MPIDPAVLAEARELIVNAGMADFVPASSMPASTDGYPVAIDLIDPPTRSAGVPNFDGSDVNRPGVMRSTSILAAIRSGTPLPPIELIQRIGEQRFQLHNGFHRLHLFAALGYTHVAARVMEEDPSEY